MPRYQYEVKKGPGQPTTGVMEAESQRAAVSRLRDMGYFPISVEEFTGEANQDSVKHALTRIRLKDRNVFFRQLANLIESGMPITRAMGTLAEQTENPKLCKVIEQLRHDVQQGSSFADALERHPKLFSVMICNMVRAGETGGMLESVLWRIVAFGEQEEELRGKAVGAMVYPAFLLFVGSVSIFILLSFVFPKFVAVLADFHADLPLPTRIVMGVCDFMGAYWWAILLGVAAIVVALVSYVRSEVGRRQFDRMMLRVPVSGAVVQRYEMAKFARTFGTLLDNGVPILNALRITADTISNTAITTELEYIHDRVTEGESMSEGLRHTKHFPPMVVNMFAIGEESGRIGAVTKRIAEAYDTEVDRAVKAMAALMEPLLIVVMGVVVGFLVVAMLLPMLTLGSSIK